MPEAYGGSALAFQARRSFHPQRILSGPIWTRRGLIGVRDAGTCRTMIINTARDAADLLERHFVFCEGEKLVAAHLDAERGLIRAIEQAGGAFEVELSIRAIIADALSLGASGLIVAHNHPSGDPMPSEADLAATRA